LLQHAVVQRTNGAQLASSNGFCVGDRLSIADLALCSLLGWFQAGAFIGIPPTLLGDYHRHMHVLEAVSTIPQI
jgi:glutathione S-transferase